LHFFPFDFFATKAGQVQAVLSFAIPEQVDGMAAVVGVVVAGRRGKRDREVKGMEK